MSTRQRKFRYRYINTDELRRVRQVLGLSLEDVAAKIDPGLDRQLIHRLEKGRTKSMELLCEVAEAYGMDVTVFIYPRPKKRRVKVVASEGG